MRQMLLVGVVLASAGVAVAAMVQQSRTPPAATPTAPPRPLANVPSSPAPTKARETPLANFEPLAAFPQHTQIALRAELLGAKWMTRMNQPQGRFLYRLQPRPATADPGRPRPEAGSRCAGAGPGREVLRRRETGRHGEPGDPGLARGHEDRPGRSESAACRCHSSPVCNRVGFAAVLALAIYELPAADAKLVAEAERLCDFLHKQCRGDGSVNYTEGPSDDPGKTRPGGNERVSGRWRCTRSMARNRIQPAAWKARRREAGDGVLPVGSSGPGRTHSSPRP